jgi:hypothetical protein
MMSLALMTHRAAEGEYPNATCVKPGQLQSWRIAAGSALSLRGLCGQAWVTMEGDQGDYVVGPGVEAVFDGPGLLVLEALDSGVVCDVRHGAFPMKREPAGK